jgi:hypothetical protein
LRNRIYARYLGTVLWLVATAYGAERGALNPDITQDTIEQTICVKGYTATVRPAANYTNDMKALLLMQAGLDSRQIRLRTGSHQPSCSGRSSIPRRDCGNFNCRLPRIEGTGRSI